MVNIVIYLYTVNTYHYSTRNLNMTATRKQVLYVRLGCGRNVFEDKKPRILNNSKKNTKNLAVGKIPNASLGWDKRWAGSDDTFIGYRVKTFCTRGPISDEHVGLTKKFCSVITGVNKRPRRRWVCCQVTLCNII